MPGIIPFRFRVGKDDDLEAAFEALPKYLEKADVIREALRMYFFNAPTPLRDSMGYFEQTLSKLEAPREVKVKESLPEPKHTQPPKFDIDFTTVTPISKSDDNELESKLNKSLGF